MANLITGDFIKWSSCNKCIGLIIKINKDVILVEHELITVLEIHQCITHKNNKLISFWFRDMLEENSYCANKEII